MLVCKLIQSVQFKLAEMPVRILLDTLTKHIPRLVEWMNAYKDDVTGILEKRQ